MPRAPKPPQGRTGGKAPDAVEEVLGTAEEGSRLAEMAEQLAADGLGEDAAATRFAAVEKLLAARELDAAREAVAQIADQDGALDWVEGRLSAERDGAARAILLRTRLSILRHQDTRAVLDLADEAMAAAAAVADGASYASVLASAAFAAYRRGDARAADRFAALAAAHRAPDARSAIDSLRARMFAAMATESLEQALVLARDIRDQALAAGILERAANESNNMAEMLLRLGRPAEAQRTAVEGERVAVQAKARALAGFARVLDATARGELGDLDGAIPQLAAAAFPAHAGFAADTALALARFLVERGRSDDLEEAAQLAAGAAARAAGSGVAHSVTALLATEARAHGRRGDAARAREALSRARAAAQAADPVSENHLALAIGEVLPATDPSRSVALSAARARLMRAAARRENPRAYLTGVSLHRRLLELSGGIPVDLPG